MPDVTSKPIGFVINRSVTRKQTLTLDTSRISLGEEHELELRTNGWAASGILSMDVFIILFIRFMFPPKPPWLLSCLLSKSSLLSGIPSLSESSSVLYSGSIQKSWSWENSNTWGLPLLKSLLSIAKINQRWLKSAWSVLFLPPAAAVQLNCWYFCLFCSLSSRWALTSWTVLCFQPLVNEPSFCLQSEQSCPSESFS